MQAQSADGVIHDFPDGTNISVIDSVMKSYVTDAGNRADAQAAPVPAVQSDASAPMPAATRTPQTQIGADISAVGQGAVSGTGSVIAGIGRQPTAAAAQGTKSQLAVMDAIDRGENVPQDQDTIGYQFFSPEQKAKARADFTDANVEISKREPNAVTRAGMAVEGAAPGMFPVDPALEGRGTAVGRMVGGMVPALAASAGGAAVGGPVGAVLAGAAVVGSQTYDGTYQEAIAKGQTPEQADDAAGKSAALQMAAMSLPISKIIPFIPVPLREGFLKTVANVGTNFVQRGGEMGAGNTLATMAQNYVASQTYDPGRPVFNGTGDAAIDGVLAALVVHGATTAVGAARAGISAEPRPTVADIGAATDINGAIAAAGAVAEAPSAAETMAAAEAAVPKWADVLNSGQGEAVPSVAGVGSGGTAVVPAATPAAEIALPLLPKTSADAKAIASAYYQRADEVGGTLLPEFTNRFIDEAQRIAPQTPEGRAIAGDTAITGLVDRMEALRDQPISLQGAQEIDERLGDMIDQEYGLKGMSKEGHNLLDLQTKFRNMILDAGPEDTTNGIDGFDAIKQGRLAWAQAMKMMDFERILNRAAQTDNPVTSIRAGIRTLLSNPSRARAYSAEEIAALKDAANRGAMGSVLHVFGSRLTPLAVGAAGMSSGVIPGLIGAGISHVATTGMRNLATRIQMGRADNAMSVLGSSVPPMPAARVADTALAPIPAPITVPMPLPDYRLAAE